MKVIFQKWPLINSFNAQHAASIIISAYNGIDFSGIFCKPTYDLQIYNNSKKN